MNAEKIIKAWRDPEFRATLSKEEIALLNQHPAGLSPLTRSTEEETAGGNHTNFPDCDTMVTGCGTTLLISCSSEANCSYRDCYSSSPFNLCNC